MLWSEGACVLRCATSPERHECSAEGRSRKRISALKATQSLGSVVYPRLLQARTNGGPKFLRIKRDITLQLKKASVMATKVAIRTTKDGSPHDEFVDGNELEKHLYQDVENMASITVEETDGGVKVNGIVGPKLRIRPLPTAPRSEEGHIAHRLFEVQESSGVAHETVYANPPPLQEMITERRADSPVPEDVTLELYVVCDSEHSGNMTKTELGVYVATMINAVNLRYSTVSYPRIKMQVTGLGKTEASQEKYITVHDGYIISRRGLHDLREHIMKVPPPRYPDMVLLITGHDLASVLPTGLETRVEGVAFAAGICSLDKVAIVEDVQGAFTAVHPITHELAHLIGAVHDGDKAPDYIPGHPGAQDCPWDQGYIMSYVTNSSNHYRFSPCTVREFIVTLKYRGPKCWHVSTDVDILLQTRRKPGQVVTRAQYCQIMYSHNDWLAVDMNDTIKRMCKFRCCFKRWSMLSDVKCIVADALDGIECDLSKGSRLLHRPQHHHHVAHDLQHVCVQGRPDGPDHAHFRHVDHVQFCLPASISVAASKAHARMSGRCFALLLDARPFRSVRTTEIRCGIPLLPLQEDCPLFGASKVPFPDARHHVIEVTAVNGVSVCS